MQNFIIDAFDRFRAANSAEQRWAAGLHVFGEVGIDWITELSAPQSNLERTLIHSSIPQEFIDSYVTERVYRDDPWIDICQADLPPVHLDVTGTLQQASSNRFRLAKLADSFSVESVTLHPIERGAHVRGVVIYARDAEAKGWVEHPEGSKQVRLAVGLFAAFFQPTGTERQSIPYKCTARLLSEREREALAWLAEGLRSDRVAERMGVSTVTVHKHLANARRKLRASTREQAIAIAVRDGEI